LARRELLERCISRQISHDCFLIGFDFQITLCLGFWAAGLASIMDPKNDVAVTATYINGSLVTDENGVFALSLKANVYFFSWASFAVALLLAGSFAREVVQVQWPQNIPKRSLWWYALCATSLIVMSIASRTFHLTDCKNAKAYKVDGFTIDPTGACKRVKFGISIGVVSGVLALIMGSVSHLLPVILESIVAIAMMVLWCFGVGFVTFGSKAPAASVGNFYFSTWASFIITLFLASDAVANAYRKMRGEDEPRGEVEQTTPKSTQPEAEYRV